MSYAALEASVDQAAPFFLYAFREGEAVWRFTSRAESLESLDPALGAEAAPVVWEAASVAHSSVVQSGDLDRVRLDLTWPLSHAFARRFLEPLGSVPTGLTIWRGHEALPDAPVAHYKGRVTGAEVEGERLVLTAESVQSLMRRAGVRAKYQRLCRHALYGRGCGLDVAQFWQAVSVSAVDGRSVTVPALAGFAQGWFSGGILRVGSDLGFILEHSGDQLLLSRPMAALAGAALPLAADAAPGCDLTVGTCADKFANADNFGGFPFIPGDNPFTGSVA